jgi:hypothetical protein
MAATSLNSFNRVFDSNQSLYERLNSVWHERALQAFMLIVLAHWGNILYRLIRSMSCIGRGRKPEASWGCGIHG